MTPEPTPTPVGKHPWSDESGMISPAVAASWMANHILMAGGMATTAFKCAALIAEDIERNPSKFGINPAFDRHPYNPNRPNK